MKIPVNIVVCSDPSLKCVFNPEHKTICPAMNAAVVCNEKKSEKVYLDLNVEVE